MASPIDEKRNLWKPLVWMVLLWAGGFLLLLIKPLWLSPPYWHWTPWLYLPLLFAWLPAYVWAKPILSQRLKPVLLFPLVLSGLGCMFCGVQVLAPRNAYEFSMPLQLDVQTCRQAGDLTRCSLCSYNSDTGKEIVLQSDFRSLSLGNRAPAASLMWRTGFVMVQRSPAGGMLACPDVQPGDEGIEYGP